MNKPDKKPAQIFHFDLYGKREEKYDFLSDNSLSTIDWKELNPQLPELFFVPKDFAEKSDYDKGFKISDLYNNISTGYYTSCDEVVIANSIKELEQQIKDYDEGKFDFQPSLIEKTTYRPFDNKVIYFEPKLITRSRSKFISNFLGKENYILLSGKGTKAKFINHFFLTKIFSELKCAEYTTGSYMLPLYLYPETKVQQQSLSGFGTLTGLNETNETLKRVPNLNAAIVTKISKSLGLTFVPEKTTPPVGHSSKGEEFAPIDILDYIYAVLHSPTYREKYKEFLKIDFPRVPYPKDLTTFEKLSNLGSQLREIHLLESPKVEDFITQYPIDGDNVVVKPSFVKVQNFDKAETGKVFINETQYFDYVPEVSWNFYIGGYQPAQKWLKDRKDRKLEFDEIAHYQKIIVALSETDRIMKEIDTIEIE